MLDPRQPASRIAMCSAWTALAALLPIAARAAESHRPVARVQHVQHVVLLSVDGLHSSDLAWYVRHRPHSTLATLSNEGRSYTDAWAPFPSDSVPGALALLAGGRARTTGVYYDDSYSRALLPAGTTTCKGARPGAQVPLIESIDRDPHRLDAGQHIAGPYGAASTIARLSGDPSTLLDPARLPVDAARCRPILPHEYLRTNTVFEVAHEHGLRTAWSDKHPAYELLRGRSGHGIDDLFTPEINGATPDAGGTAGGPDYTKDNLATQQYDAFKVEAVLNWLRGHDHAGEGDVGVPAILGMNFQSVSTAQKLDTSMYLTGGPGGASTRQSAAGGYDASGQTPGPVLLGALAFVDSQIARIKAALTRSDTVLIVTAKHGQSPRRRAELTVINDRSMIEAVNGAWARLHPQAATPFIAHAVDDDGVLLWFSTRSPEAWRFAHRFLWHYSGQGIGFDAASQPVAKRFVHAGLSRIYSGHAAARFLGADPQDERVPDLVGIARQGSLWAGNRISKIAEHGGNSADDRHVPLLIWGAGIRAGTVGGKLSTIRVAPTILRLLGLPIEQLQATRRERSGPLPGLAPYDRDIAGVR